VPQQVTQLSTNNNSHSHQTQTHTSKQELVPVDNIGRVTVHTCTLGWALCL